MIESKEEEDDGYDAHLTKKIEKNFDHMKSIQKFRNNNVSVADSISQEPVFKSKLNTNSNVWDWLHKTMNLMKNKFRK